ncbi:hypothetical protein GLOIN_2v1471114 [Rhizophagus clarus]|uniref:Uncharacterized protein n=1 Tax=Rhizophagus clarus TaxID=94130 RepID=A0A8H3L3L6_9GLOM|nr:hypothetical protein GLOIN_2v1471114 [Rhizophagus clarus]
MAICYSCNELIYLGIEHLSVGVRCVYNALEGKFITEKFRDIISFNGTHWGMYQHWATACTGNRFCKLNFKKYMEMKQRVPLDKWMSFHQYDLQINQFGKFRRRGPYTSIIDNNYILENFGIYAEEKLYSYALWLENVSRRIRRIRQRRAFLSALNCKSDDEDYHHLYCDLTIKKPDSPHLKGLLELLVTASIPKLEGHFEQVFKYEKQLHP